jgi:hypothetical protein
MSIGRAVCLLAVLAVGQAAYFQLDLGQEQCVLVCLFCVLYRGVGRIFDERGRSRDRPGPG